MNVEQNQTGGFRSCFRRVTPYVPGEQPKEQIEVEVKPE